MDSLTHKDVWCPALSCLIDNLFPSFPVDALVSQQFLVNQYRKRDKNVMLFNTTRTLKLNFYSTIRSLCHRKACEMLTRMTHECS